VYLRDVLAKIVARHPMSRVELLPFAYVQATAGQGSGLATPIR
jgi:hypothetical protein